MAKYYYISDFPSVRRTVGTPSSEQYHSHTLYDVIDTPHSNNTQKANWDRQYLDYNKKPFGKYEEDSEECKRLTEILLSEW